MSRAGKFIPGGASSNRPLPEGAAGRTGPIRAPAPTGPPPEPAGVKKPTGKGSSLIKPVAKNQRLPIVIMSAIVCCLLVSVAWYEFAVLPAKVEAEAMQKQRDDALLAQQKLTDELKTQQDEMRKNDAAARATLTIDSVPSGASVTIGDEHKPTPASFTDLPPGPVSLVIHADGYEDFKQDTTVAVDKPTDLGTINLVLKAGTLTVSSEQSDVSYTLTGPGDYSHEGQAPDKIEKLPPGDYQLVASQHDWKLNPITVTIHDQETVAKEIKFPYAKLTVTSTPAGATVREGRTVMGQTPLALNSLRPGDLQISVDLVPFNVQRLTIEIPEFGDITKHIAFPPDKNFIAACGMPMMWIADGNFWAGKYNVRQSDFEKVAGYNPSAFRRPNRPVEQISWEDAAAFCDKLTQYEQRAGKLPAGYHYSLPTESQWSLFSADADINLAPMSRIGSLTSTQDSGYSEPNKYGLYDTLGNVWEWCLDKFDDKGNHSLRGGSWLSSPDNFPGADTRSAGTPKYSDRFTGFRVVLISQ